MKVEDVHIAQIQDNEVHPRYEDNEFIQTSFTIPLNSGGHLIVLFLSQL